MSSKKVENSYSHVLKYTGIFGGVQGISILVGIIRNKLCAVILGPEGFGLITLFTSTVTFVSTLSDLGLSFSAVRHVSELFESGDKSKIDHFIKVVKSVEDFWFSTVRLPSKSESICSSPDENGI